jgi:dihydropteroate synthase
MGILNVTPDSFSDGGRYTALDAALAQAERLIAEGAAILDIGGESTRPGADAVSADEEIARIVPVIDALQGHCDVPISVDTSKLSVMAAAVSAGACIVNDVFALRAPGARDWAALAEVGVCLMHMQGEPRTMQTEPRYADVVAEVGAFLADQREACLAAGIAADRIVLDPGIGFGKTLEHNLRLLKDLPSLHRLGAPLLVGVSRKSFLGRVLGGRDLDQRLAGGLGAAAWSVAMGVQIIRSHDVAATRDAIEVVAAIMQGTES